MLGRTLQGFEVHLGSLRSIGGEGERLNRVHLEGICRALGPCRHRAYFLDYSIHERKVCVHWVLSLELESFPRALPRRLPYSTKLHQWIT